MIIHERKIEIFNRLEYDHTVAKKNQPGLMYIRGHSYEFDRNNNRDRIEEICARLSGREDTRYATNIEIYDYVKAYESLIFSADETKVYNSTARTVWFTFDCKHFKVEPNATIKLV